MIFLNHAANGQMPNSTVQAITDYLHAEQQRSAYLAALDAAPQLQQLYHLLAELIGSRSQDIALTTGNSHGWTAVVGAMPWQAGDKVLITPGEWGGNVAMLQLLQSRHGITVQTMPCLADGSLDLPALEMLLQTDQQIKLLALTWVPANGSTIYPAEAVGALCSQYKVTFVVDAAQALGHFPVDVQRLQCDALTAPGRKWLNAPRGTGLLYVHPRLLPKLSPLVVDHQSSPITAEGAQLRADTRRFEQSESAVSLKLGFKAALEHARAMGWDTRYAAIARSAVELRQALRTLPHVTLQEHPGNPAENALVAFSVQGFSAQEVQQALLEQGISVAVSGMGYTPLDMQARGLESVVRASVSWQTTSHDIAALAAALQTVRKTKA